VGRTFIGRRLSRAPREHPTTIEGPRTAPDSLSEAQILKVRHLLPNCKYEAATTVWSARFQEKEVRSRLRKEMEKWRAHLRARRGRISKSSSWRSCTATAELAPSIKGIVRTR